MIEALRTSANRAKYALLAGVQALSPFRPRFHYAEQILWWDDRSWTRPYRKYLARNSERGRPPTRILDRRFFIVQVANWVAGLPGSTAECGVRHGVGSAFICQTLLGRYRPGCGHFAFDSFAGLSEPEPADRVPGRRNKWWKGKLKTDFETVQAFLADFDFCRVVKGWIPDCFALAAHQSFRLVHIDVDLRQPTWDSLEFFYPRLIPGGVFLLDDHGFANCPGARQAAIEFFAGKPEKIVEVPSGQAFVVKQ